MYPWILWGFFVVGLVKHFSFCEEPITHSTLTNMEEITDTWRNMSLFEREDSDFPLQEEQRSQEFILVAKFVTPRFLNMDIVARTFKQIWRSTNGFSIRNLGNHIVLFVFNSSADVDKIIQNQPWSFDKHLVVLQRYVKDTPIQDLDFSRAIFWVQVHNIPIRYITKRMV